MGAGQIGGIATLSLCIYGIHANIPRCTFSVDIDFDNAAGFHGVKADVNEGQFVIYFFSHAMMFCMGALIEAHVVLTPASCVFGEKAKFNVYAGTHRFLENAGISRRVHHVCYHKGYNHSGRWDRCRTENLALLVLNRHFTIYTREPGADYIMNRVRYGITPSLQESRIGDRCYLYGWGSRRNGYLVPLLINLRRVDVSLLSSDKCPSMWNYENKYLCVQQLMCKSDRFGALCPDDLGSVIVCSGFVHGMMTSRMVDRPCGVGFLDLAHFNKFLTCAVDDSRDVVYHDVDMSIDYTTPGAPTTPSTITPPPHHNHSSI